MGKEEVFQLREIPILSPALALQYPSLKTYEGTSIERPKVTVRVSSSRAGINAWIQGLEGPDLFIQPVKAQRGSIIPIEKPSMINALLFIVKRKPS